MCPCLLADGTKQNQTRGEWLTERRQPGDREKGGGYQGDRGVVYENFLASSKLLMQLNKTSESTSEKLEYQQKGEEKTGFD